MKTKLLASSASLEGITRLVNHYYFDENRYTVNMDDGTVFDTRDQRIKQNVIVRKVSGRYRFEMKD